MCSTRKHLTKQSLLHHPIPSTAFFGFTTLYLLSIRGLELKLSSSHLGHSEGETEFVHHALVRGYRSDTFTKIGLFPTPPC